ncbi:MAG: ergothioneine biosynthesis protein EgtB [Chitinophagales bacterium]
MSVFTPTKPILLQYQKVRKHTEFICQPLMVEDYVVQAMADVSPPKWHIGHVTWFFETFVLMPNKKGYRIYNEQYPFVFNSYYEAAGARVVRTNRGNLSRPSVEDIYKYRAYVDQQMQEWLSETDLTKELHDLVTIGLNHEQQHQELLLTDIKYILGNNPLFPKYKEIIAAPTNNQLTDGWLSVEGGKYVIGYQGDDFYYDNEKGVHTIFLHNYEVQDRLVTNGEFIEFIEAGGYQQYQHWLSAGWSWVNENKATQPMYWYKIEGQWYLYKLSGLQQVNPYEPVTHVNFFEADAFARWKGKRLPTEFEWEVACRHYAPTIAAEANFSDRATLHPIVQQNGNNQMYGDVWEWTNSSYLAYPYYEKVDGALGEYNGKFMIDQMVLRGGSCATSQNHIRPTYRNFFPTHSQWQFMGFRLADYV